MMKLAKLMVALAGVLGAGLALQGCEKDNTPPPNPLTKYPFTTSMNVLWKTHATDGSGIGTTLGLFETDAQLLAVGVNGKVVLLDKATGRTVWSIRVPHEISARAVADTERVFVPTRDGFVVALDRSTGKPLWSKSLSSLSLAGVCVESGIVVVHEHDGDVAGLNASTGAVLWRYSGSTPVLGLQGSSEPVATTSMAYVGTSQGQVFAFDLQTGAVKWDRPIAIPNGPTAILRMIDINATPLLGDSVLYAAAYHGNLVSLNASSGDVIWERPFSVYQNLAGDLPHNALFVTDENSDVYKVDTVTGATGFKQTALEYRNVSAPTLLGAHVLVGDGEGYLHSLSNTDGTLEARLRLDHSAIVGQGVSDASAGYFVTQSGDVVAVRVG